MSKIIVVKGISGSGKSSRVFQLIKYLEVLGCQFEDFHYLNKEGKDRVVGLLCKNLGIVFLGKIYKSGTVERWQGYDSVTGCFMKSEYFSEFLKDQKGKFTMFVEGAGVTQTNRLRPKFLHEQLGYESIMIQYYNYDNKQDYLDRITYRSGKVPTKATMWDKNSSFIAESAWSLIDQKTIDCEVYINQFNAPISDLGVKFFKFIGLDKETIDDFVEFTKEFDYINKNNFENFEKCAE